MKCSPYRKRYILMKVLKRPEGDELIRSMSRIFHSKEKYRTQAHSIILTDQFLKDQVCKHIEKYSSIAKVITVSGTIKKCKNTINNSGISQSTER